jgi:uncharacterized protein YqgC (DUF456 family)
MSTVLSVAALVILAGVCVLALASLVVGLPGTFLILAAAAIYAWTTGFAAVTWGTLGWLALLAVAGELVELALGSGVAGTTRPSRRVAIASIAGSIAGGLLGAPLLFGLGALIGALAGAFVGAGLAAHSETGDLGHAVQHGFGAMKGRFAGFVAKSAIGVAMTLLVMFEAVGGAFG